MSRKRSGYWLRTTSIRPYAHASLTVRKPVTARPHRGTFAHDPMKPYIAVRTHISNTAAHAGIAGRADGRHVAAAKPVVGNARSAVRMQGPVYEEQDPAY